MFEYRDADWNSYYGIDITVKRKIDGYTSSQSERKKLAYGDYLAKYGGGLGRSSWNSHSIGDMCGTDRQTEQPCLTDEEKYQKILNAVMDLITKRLASGQEVRQISVSQDDNENYCTCDCCFNHGLDDPNCEVNEGFTLDMEGWSKICERIYIWDYHMDFTFYLSAFPYFDQMHNNVRYFAQNNVIGYYAQGYRSGAVTGRFGELSAYMASKLAWNPNMTDEEYDKNVNEFLALYYGDGWETIRSYYDFIIESGDKKGHFYVVCTWPWENVRKMDYALHLEALDGWFDDALAKADNVQELRIEQLMIHYKFLSLSAIHTAYWTYGSEKIREEYIKEYDKLISDIEYYKISFGEGLNLEGLYDYGTAPYFLYKYIYQE